MPSLQSSARLGESHLQTDDGMDVYATIFPAGEGEVPSYDFSTSRNLCRVSVDSLLNVNQILIDAYGRRFLTAYHDLAQMGASRLYKVFRLYNLTHQVSWTRRVVSNDPLTGLSRNVDAITELGPIWVSMEMIGREAIDLTFRVKEQSRQILTNAAIELNDTIDNQTVKRIDQVVGITRAELQ